MGELVKYAMLIDGEWAEASDGARFESVDPHDGTPWASIPEATEADVHRAVAAAARAGETGEWSRLTASQRGHYLRRLGDLLAQASEELGRIESRDTGKILSETLWQAKYIAEYFYFYAGAADKIAGETLPVDKQDMLVFTQREPLGVVAAIVPWNSQLFLSAVKLAPALAGGNTVVLKASEHASAPVLEFAKLIEKAGIPRGVVNVLTGHGEPCGRALTSHPQVARVSFTGGAAAARNVIGNTARNLAELSLELGGKSPFIVFDDADLESAVNGAVAGIFAASGQSCVAGSRLYLHEKIADEFLAELVRRVALLRIGDPRDERTQVGPLCTLAQLAVVEQQLQRARQQGARIVAGGERPAGMKGNYFQPTIVDCPSEDMEILDTELFAPVLAVRRFGTEEEVLRYANGSQHGLAAGVFTSNGARSLRMSRSLRAGIVWVNTYRAISPVAEFGGQKLSGYGRESGFQALYDYTRTKTIWMNASEEPLANPFVPR